MNESHRSPAARIHPSLVALDRYCCAEHWEMNVQFHCLLPGVMVTHTHALRSPEAIQWYLYKLTSVEESRQTLGALKSKAFPWEQQPER